MRALIGLQSHGSILEEFFLRFYLLLGLLRCQLHSLQLAAAAAVPDMAGIGRGRASSKLAASPNDHCCMTWLRASACCEVGYPDTGLSIHFIQGRLKMERMYQTQQSIN